MVAMTLSGGITSYNDDTWWGVTEQMGISAS